MKAWFIKTFDKSQVVKLLRYVIVYSHPKSFFLRLLYVTKPNSRFATVAIVSILFFLFFFLSWFLSIKSFLSMEKLNKSCHANLITILSDPALLSHALLLRCWPLTCLFNHVRSYEAVLFKQHKSMINSFGILFQSILICMVLTPIMFNYLRMYVKWSCKCLKCCSFIG